MTTIIGIGLACADYLLQVEDLKTVAHGGKLLGFKTQGGGMAATAMVTAARLGAQAELWTVLGQDPLGQEIIAELEAENVNLSQARQFSHITSQLTAVLVDKLTGERSFLSSATSLQNRFDDFEPEPDWFRIDSAQALLVDGLWNNFALKGLQRARQKGVPTCGDIEYMAGNERLLPFIDYLIVPEEMAQAVAGCTDAAALQQLATYGAKMVVITLGSMGAIYWVDGRIASTPAFDVDAVDTTGAGDVFHGAFVYGLAQGWMPDQLMLFSSAVAALKCTQLGGRSGIPDLSQTQRFLSARLPGIDLSWLGELPNESSERIW